MSGSVAVRRGHRLLGAARIPPRLGRRCGSHVSVPPHIDVRVPLAPGGGRVVVSLHGHDVPHVGWAIRLSR
jgi:hypothetical protein